MSVATYILGNTHAWILLVMEWRWLFTESISFAWFTLSINGYNYVYGYLQLFNIIIPCVNNGYTHTHTHTHTHIHTHIHTHTHNTNTHTHNTNTHTLYRK